MTPLEKLHAQIRSEIESKNQIEQLELIEEWKPPAIRKRFSFQLHAKSRKPRSSRCYEHCKPKAGEIRFKDCMNHLAQKFKTTTTAIYEKFHKRNFRGLKLRKHNRRVIFVKTESLITAEQILK